MGELIVKQITQAKQIRVRDLDGVAKIEVDHNSISLLNNKQRIDEISKKLKMIGFSSVIIDPDGYKMGKLNQSLKLNI